MRLAAAQLCVSEIERPRSHQAQRSDTPIAWACPVLARPTARRNTRMGPEFRIGERQAVPSIEDAARAERVVGTQPSEDASHLLPPLSVAPEPRDRDYGPRPWLEFVVDLAGATP